MNTHKYTLITVQPEATHNSHTPNNMSNLYLKTKTKMVNWNWRVVHSSLKIYTSLVVSSVRSRSLESNAQQ